MVAVL